eukprot:TRINITY_DN4267_c1_g1_i1.p1 TRINITY_DN4267_c1_g1~~TRINITY_DN4267_c1_g1_i1.p1  ORF type:complete len:457 (+),score=59.64 TRINITY_DN4267_c1_g1_i1:101-1471(+)
MVMRTALVLLAAAAQSAPAPIHEERNSLEDSNSDTPGRAGVGAGRGPQHERPLRAHGRGAQDGRPRFGRSAVVFFGKLPRETRSGRIDLMLFDKVIRGSIERSVLRDFSASAEVVDVFAHSWRETQAHANHLLRFTLEKLVRATGARARHHVHLDAPLSKRQLSSMMPWWNPNRLAQTHGLVSIERAVQFALHSSRKLGRPYDLILLMRLDLYFFRPFGFSHLTSGPFYVGNRCAAVGAEVRTGGRICRQLRLSECRGSVGDFYFLSSGRNMARVFGNFTNKVGRAPQYWSPVHSPDSSSVQPDCWEDKDRKPRNMHQTILPLLHGLGLSSSIRRHLYHGMDYEFARGGRYLPVERLRCEQKRDGGGWLHRAPHTASLPGGTKHSICPESAYFCTCSEELLLSLNFFCCSDYGARGSQCPLEGNYSRVQCRRPPVTLPSVFTSLQGGTQEAAPAQL